MKRLKPTVKLDRSGTFRVEVLKTGTTTNWILNQDGTTTLHSEVPWSHWIVAEEGVSELAAHGYARRREREGLTVRVITHEQHLVEKAEITRSRRSEAAKWAWEDRRSRQVRERAKEYPPLKVVK